MPIKVFIVSHHARIIDTLKSMALIDGHVVILGRAPTMEDALEKCAAQKPDVFIFDADPAALRLDTERIAQLRKIAPRVRILALLDGMSVEGIRGLLHAGVDGILSYDSDAVDLSQTINAIYAGKSVFPLALIASLL